MDTIEKYRSLTVANQRYLIHRTSGKALMVNDTAGLFLDLHARISDKQEVCAEAATIFGVPRDQVSADLDAFLESLEQPNDKSFGINSQISDSSGMANGLVFTSDPETAYFSTGGIKFRITCADQNINALYKAIFSPLVAKKSHVNLVEISLHEELGGWAIACNGRMFDEALEAKFLVGRLRDLMIEQMTLAGGHRLGLHASGVLSCDGKALLFAAPSGFGKSTLSTYLALKGSAYLGDDSLVVDLTSQTVIPFPSAAKLDRQSINALGLENGLPDCSGARLVDGNFVSKDGVEQLVELSASSQLQENYDLKALVFSRFDQKLKSQIRRLDSSEIFSRLTESGLYAYQGASADTTEAYIKCFANVNAYELNYSDLAQARELMQSAKLL